MSKNIPKSDDVLMTSRFGTIKTLNLLHSTMLFNELFDLFTDEDFEKGDTITVNEYTQMMDAWLSTGIRE